MPGMLRKSTAFVPRYQKFESISLQRRVSELSVPERWHSARSRKFEYTAGNMLPWLTAKVVALGLEHRVPTPANAFVYAALKPYVNGPPALARN